MSGFDEVDAWFREKMRHVRVEHPAPSQLQRATKRERARVSRAIRREEQGELRAFCIVDGNADFGHLRFRCRPRGTHIHVERPCGFVPGKWRALWTLPVNDFVAAAILKGLTHTQAASVLVERDRWLDEGAPRRTRLPVL